MNELTVCEHNWLIVRTLNSVSNVPRLIENDRGNLTATSLWTLNNKLCYWRGCFEKKGLLFSLAHEKAHFSSNDTTIQRQLR